VRVLAVRDDGAQLIGDPELSCALLATDDGSAIMPVASALARGYWGDGGGTATIRPETAAMIKQMSAEHDKWER
jgi:hypothetical protein